MFFDLFDTFEAQAVPNTVEQAAEMGQEGEEGLVPMLDEDDNSLLDPEIDADQNGIPDFMESPEGIQPLVDEEGKSLLDTEIDADQNGIPDAMETPEGIIPLVDEEGNSLLPPNVDADQDGIPDVMEAENSFVQPETSQDTENSVLQVSHNMSEAHGDSILAPVFDALEDGYNWFLNLFTGDRVTVRNFTDDGHFDTKNNVIVVGNVEHDIQFTEKQTHQSCSLMAQEQFVHRYTGQPIPEDYLEYRASQWGVYTPDCGTDYNGQTMILEHFNIPHQRFMGELEDINKAISEHKDVIIGVDAREFYQDPTFAPGSGHAVAIVGCGLDPDSHEVTGYYVTDSNYEQSAHFVDVERLENSWDNDLITVPEKEIYA